MPMMRAPNGGRPGSPGAIYEWLKQMATGPGGLPPGAGILMRQPTSATATAPQVGPPGAGMQTLPTGTPFPNPQSMTPQITPQQPAFPQPQSKTDQRSPVQFAWGGNEPQNYQPGISDILSTNQFAGAPDAREGFMGADPVAGGMKEGGFGASAEWGDVANPQGFDAFAQAPGVEETIQSASNPMWRQEQESAIEQAQKIAIGEAMIQKESDVEAEAARKERLELDADINKALADETQRREAAGLPELTQDETNNIASNVMMLRGMKSPI